MWRTVKLGEVCDFQGGSQPPKKEFVFEPQEGYVRFLQIRDFKSDKNVTYIPISKKNRLCNTDDIFIGRYGASVGQILRGLEGAYNVALMKTIPNEELISKGWLYAYLNSSLFQKPLMEASSRSAQNGFSKDDISALELPLPSLAEQQRIVAKLDAAFAEIDRFESVIKGKLSDFDALRLKTYQAIIKKHCSEQRQCKLSELVDESCSLSYGIVQPGDEFADGLPVVRPVDLKSKWIGEIDLKRVAHERAESYQRTKLSGGEVLLCVRGSTGVVSLASDELIGGNVTRGIIPIRFADVVNNEYGYYALQSEGAQKQIADKTYGATLQQINVKDVKNLIIDVPKIEEQLNAVAEIIKADDYLNELKSSTQRQLENAKQLKSAILAQELQPPQSEAA